MSSALTSIHIGCGDDVSSLPADVIVAAQLRFGERRIHIAVTKAPDRPHIVAVTISSSSTIPPALEGLPPVTWTCVNEAINGDDSHPRYVWYAIAQADSIEAPVTDIAVPLTPIESAELINSGFVIGDPIDSNTADGTYHLWTKLAVTQEEAQTVPAPASPVSDAAFGGPSVGGFRAGDLCDCMDTVQTWLDARVLSVDVEREGVWVHYDGWADSWNEMITLRSRRLAKYRTQVIYRPINEKPFKLYVEETLLNTTMQRTAKIIQALEERAQAEAQTVVDSNKPAGTASSATQIPFAPLNARLQSLVSPDDYTFLTWTENLKMIHFCVNATLPTNMHTDDPTATTIPPLIARAVQFLKMNMKLICYALQTEIPLSPCWTEALIRIFGGQACHLYHRYGVSPNDREREEGDDGTSPIFASREATRSRQIDSKQRLPSVILIQLINLFGRYGGFAAINRQIAPPPPITITQQQTTPQSPTQQLATLSAPPSRTTTPVPTTELATLSLSRAASSTLVVTPVTSTNPLSTIAALIRCLSCTAPFLEQSFASSYISSLKLPDLTRTHLARITDDDLKALDKNQFIALITHIQQLLICGHVVTASQSQEFAEAMTMTMILRMINAQVLATRLEGILQVELIIAQIRANNKNGFDPPPNSAGVVSAASSLNVQVTAPQLLSWLEENKVVDSLVGRDSHEQIVKRTPVILKFLAINQKLQPRHIDMLWSACAGKHEGLVRIVYDLIADLASVMADELLETVYYRIVEKPLSDYKDYDIQLIKLFTFNAVRARNDAAMSATVNKNNKSAGGREKREEKWFGLELFWNILHNSTSAASSTITTLSAQALAQLLAAPEFKVQLGVYLDKCLNTLTLSPTAGGASAVVPALQLAQQMIEKQPEQPTKHSMSRADLIQVLENDKKLLSLIVESIVAYEKFAIPMVNQANAVKTVNTNDNDTAVLLLDKSDLMIGGYTHSIQLSTRFNFLSFLLSSSKLTLAQSHVDSLWSTFILPHSPAADQSRLLQWLSLAVEGKDKKDHIIFPPKLTKYILTDLLCSPNKIDHSTLTSHGLSCFEAYFIHINYGVTEALLSASRLNPVVLNYSKLVGVDALWLIAINAKLPIVATTASQFLITLHLRVDFLLQSAGKKAILKAFVDKCMQQIAVTIQQTQLNDKDIKKKTTVVPPATTPTKKEERKGFNVDQSTDALTADRGRRLHRIVSLLDSFLDRIHRGDLMSRPRFAVGNNVKASWKTQPKIYEARISALNRDGTYAVQYADGDYDPVTPDRNLHAVDRERREQEARASQLPPDDDLDSDAGFPRQILSANTVWFDLLFKLLGQSGPLSLKVSELLTRLPVHQPLVDTVRNIALTDNTIPAATKASAATMSTSSSSAATPTSARVPIDWNYLFPGHSISKLLYMLRVVKEFVVPPPLPEATSPTPQQQQQQQQQQGSHPGVSSSPVLSVDGETGVADPKWCEAFVMKGGFKHLYGILMDQGKLDDVTDTLSQRCLAALLEIIRHLLHFSLPNPQKVIFAEADASALADRLIDLAHKTVESPLSPPPEPLPPLIGNRIVNRGRLIVNPILPPNKEFEAFGQIIMHSLDALNALLKEQKECLSVVVRNKHLDEMLRRGIFHNVQQIRQSLATGLCTLAASFNEILKFITPRLLSLLHTLDTSALSQLCNEYFDLVGKLLWTEEQQMIEAKRNLTLTQTQTQTLTLTLPQSQAAMARSQSASAEAESSLSQNTGDLNDNDDSDSLRLPNFADFDVDPRHELLKALGEKIMSHPMTEASATTVDNMLCGLFTLTVQLLRNQPEQVKADIGMSCGLVGDLLSCLFAMPTSESRATGNIQPPKCKSTASRELAFNVLTELSNGCEVNGRAIVQYITPFHYHSHSGGQRPNDWSYEPRYDDKSTTGYVGLQNLGCICYMNAPLQQLFMIPQLRRAILSIDTYKEADLNDSLVYQLQLLFGILQESDVQAASPAGICHAFKDLDGKPTDVRIQDDSGSFLQKLLDRLCMSTKATPYERAIPDVLGGELCHELIGRGECNHYRDRSEEFYGLSVEVQNKKNLIDSLTQFVQGEVLEGGNAYRCDQCNKKVDTLKRTCIKKLPPTLFFILKRFALDYNTMETTKINERLEFPTYIDMRPYCIESLAGAERTAAQANNAANGKGENNDATDTHPPEYYQYVVRGIVVHTGSANGGHYYSFAQARSDEDTDGDSISSGKWFKFNDSVVTPFNPADIPDECFGGMEEAPIPPTKGNQHGGGVGTFEKYRNAYLIWYDRVKRPVESSKLNQINYATELSDTAATTVSGIAPNSNKRGRVPIPQAMMDDIWRGNINHWRDRAVFDRQYFDFVGRIVMSQMNPAKLKHSDSDAEVDAHYRPDTLADEVFATLNSAARGIEPVLTYRQQVIQLATRFLLMAFSRSRIKDNFINWITFIRKLYDGDLISSQWLIMLFTANNGLLAFEFLLLCPDIVVRNGIADLICQCLTQLAPYSHRLLQSAKREPLPEPVQESSEDVSGGAVEGVANHDDAVPNVVLDFGHMLTIYLTAASFHWRNFDSYFKVFAQFASLSSFEARWLVSQHNMAARALDFFLNDASIHPELNPLPTVAGNRIPHRDDSGAVPDQTHFLAFACQLLCACKQPQVLPIQSATPEQMIQLEPTPGLIEMNMATLELLLYREGNDGFLVHLLQLASTRKRAAPVCQAIQHMCYENISMTECILSCLRRGLEWFDWNGVRSYFRIISSLIKLSDSIQVQRVSAVMSMLVSVTVSQTRFWKLTDFCLDHIIRLAKISPLAYDYLHEHPADIEPLMTFMKKFPDPPTGRYNTYGGSAHSPPQLLKKHPESNHRMTSADYETYGLPMKLKLDSLERILCGQPLDNDATSDSDLDFSDRVLNIGDWVDCCDSQNKWNCACVVDVDYVKRLVYMKFSGWTNKWNEWISMNDGKRIRKLGTFTTKQQLENRTMKGTSNPNKKSQANASEMNSTGAGNKPPPQTR